MGGACIGVQVVKGGTLYVKPVGRSISIPCPCGMEMGRDSPQVQINISPICIRIVQQVILEETSLY